MKKLLFIFTLVLASCTKEVEVEKIVYVDKIVEVESGDVINSLQALINKLENELASSNATNEEISNLFDEEVANNAILQESLDSAESSIDSLALSLSNTIHNLDSISSQSRANGFWLIALKNQLNNMEFSKSTYSYQDKWIDAVTTSELVEVSNWNNYYSIERTFETGHSAWVNVYEDGRFADAYVNVEDIGTFDLERINREYIEYVKYDIENFAYLDSYARGHSYVDSEGVVHEYDAYVNVDLVEFYNAFDSYKDASRVMWSYSLAVDYKIVLAKWKQIDYFTNKEETKDLFDFTIANLNFTKSGQGYYHDETQTKFIDFIWRDNDRDSGYEEGDILISFKFENSEDISEISLHDPKTGRLIGRFYTDDFPSDVYTTPNVWRLLGAVHKSLIDEIDSREE